MTFFSCENGWVESLKLDTFPCLTRIPEAANFPNATVTSYSAATGTPIIFS